MATTNGTLNLRYTTAKEKRNIQQAIRILSKCRIGLQRNVQFRKYGWKRKAGVYKVAYVKDSVVVKGGPNKQLRGEMRLWKRSRGRPFRKNLVRSFGIISFDDCLYLFQRRAPGKIDTGYDCPNEEYCEYIADMIGIPDWGHNHGHDKHGNPVWYDTNLY